MSRHFSPGFVRSVITVDGICPLAQPPMAPAQQLWPRAVVNFPRDNIQVGKRTLVMFLGARCKDLPPKPCLTMKWGVQTSKKWNVKNNFNLQQQLETEAYARPHTWNWTRKKVLSLSLYKQKGAAREESELQHSTLDGCQHHFGTTGMRQQRAAILIDANTFLSVHAAASVWEDQMLKRFKGAKQIRLIINAWHHFWIKLCSVLFKRIFKRLL